jgi:predicted TIM-barrel fold metal-dependent hydrolase
VPERLIAMMDEAGIDVAVVMSTVSPEWRYTPVIPEETLEICARYPGRLVPFCNVDPRYLSNSVDADFRPLLRAYVEMGCKGVGEYLPNIPFDDPLNMNLFAQVQEVGLPLTFHVAPRAGGYYGCVDEIGLPRLERVLQTFPGLTFLAHSQVFWSEISADVTEETRGGYPSGRVTPGRVVELMRRYPNLHGDLSAGSGYNAISRDPEFGQQFLEEFQDRLYFATDIAHHTQELPIVEFFHGLRERGLISPEAYLKITWQNADRLFGLGLAEQE